MTSVSPKLEISLQFDKIKNSNDKTPDLEFADIVAKLRAAKVEPNDLVLLSVANEKNYLLFLFAILEIKATCVLLPVSTPKERILDIINYTKCTTLISTRKLGDISSKIDKYNIYRFYPEPHNFQITEPSIIILTSGTSSRPKGCILHLDRMFKNARLHAEAVNLTSKDKVLVSLPLAYSYALVAQVFAAFVTGAELVIDNASFSPAQYKKTIQKFGISSSSLTPYLAKMVNESASKDVFEQLRMLTLGGAKTPYDLTESLLQQCPKLELFLTYGLTEAGPRVATLPAHKVDKSKFGSVGLPLNGLEAKLIKENPEDDFGELCVRSHTAMSHYLGKGGRANCGKIDADGYLHSDDIFRMDEDGYLYFLKRKSDMFFIKGEKVSALNVKYVVKKNPLVKNVVVKLYQPKEDTYFDLYVYVDDVSALEDSFEKDIRRLLKRAEQPREINVFNIDTTKLYK